MRMQTGANATCDVPECRQTGRRSQHPAGITNHKKLHHMNTLTRWEPIRELEDLPKSEKAKPKQIEVKVA